MLGLVLASAACSKKAAQLDRAPAVDEPAAQQKLITNLKHRQPLEARDKTARLGAAPVSPALVPVEEDFRKDAEERLTKKSDLRAELQRIERESAASSK